jgi:hypothetical protein
MKVLVFIGLMTASMAYAQSVPKELCNPSECFAVGFKAFEAGSHNTAMPIFEPMCQKDNNAAACHLVGIMYNANKTDKDAKAKSTAAFKKACEQLKYKQACDDFKKIK